QAAGVSKQQRIIRLHRRVIRISTGKPAIVFFSSRRRHTRCLSDWSSDVCSSDLTFSVNDSPLAGRDGGKVTSRVIAARLHREARSEERRVGKECRSRWEPYQ